jgi:hypothetical protein
VRNRVNAKRNLLKLSHRWRERSHRTLTTVPVNRLKQEKEGNNEILGVIIVTEVKTTWISLPSEMMLNPRSRSIENVELNQIETVSIRSLRS